jgi:hypothetical protein
MLSVYTINICYLLFSGFEQLLREDGITKNLEGIKEDIVLLSEVLEKIIDIYQEHDTR